MCLLIITMRDEFGIVISCAVGGGRGGHGQSVNLYTPIYTVVVRWGWVMLKRNVFYSYAWRNEDCMLHEMYMTVMLAWKKEVGTGVLLSLLALTLVLRLYRFSLTNHV